MSKQYRELFEKARAAGMAAGAARTPRPMNLVGSGPDGVQTHYHVPEGMCGFAWVTVAGNNAFGRWAKQEKLASKGYPKGLWFWIGEFNQSVERKEAYASAFAKVLNEGGVEARADSRLD